MESLFSHHTSQYENPSRIMKFHIVNFTIRKSGKCESFSFRLVNANHSHSHLLSPSAPESAKVKCKINAVRQCECEIKCKNGTCGLISAILSFCLRFSTFVENLGDFRSLLEIFGVFGANIIPPNLPNRSSRHFWA